MDSREAMEQQAKMEQARLDLAQQQFEQGIKEFQQSFQLQEKGIELEEKRYQLASKDSERSYQLGLKKLGWDQKQFYESMAFEREMLRRRHKNALAEQELKGNDRRQAMQDENQAGKMFDMAALPALASRAPQGAMATLKRALGEMQTAPTVQALAWNGILTPEAVRVLEKGRRAWRDYIIYGEKTEGFEEAMSEADFADIVADEITEQHLWGAQGYAAPPPQNQNQEEMAEFMKRAGIQ